MGEGVDNFYRLNDKLLKGVKNSDNLFVKEAISTVNLIYLDEE